VVEEAAAAVVGVVSGGDVVAGDVVAGAAVAVDGTAVEADPARVVVTVPPGAAEQPARTKTATPATTARILGRA
jgi:hypothetical protein